MEVRKTEDSKKKLIVLKTHKITNKNIHQAPEKLREILREIFRDGAYKEDPLVDSGVEANKEKIYFEAGRVYILEDGTRFKVTQSFYIRESKKDSRKKVDVLSYNVGRGGSAFVRAISHTFNYRPINKSSHLNEFNQSSHLDESKSSHLNEFNQSSHLDESKQKVFSSLVEFDQAALFLIKFNPEILSFLLESNQKLLSFLLECNQEGINEEEEQKRVLKMITGLHHQELANRESSFGENDTGAKQPVHDDNNKKSFITMKKIPGCDLEKSLMNPDLEFTDEERLLIAICVMSAVKNFHEKKRVIHRDLKPANIMIDINKIYEYIQKLNNGEITLKKLCEDFYTNVSSELMLNFEEIRNRVDGVRKNPSKLNQLFIDFRTIKARNPAVIIDRANGKKIGEPENAGVPCVTYAYACYLEWDEETQTYITSTNTDNYALGLTVAQILGANTPTVGMDYNPVDKKIFAKTSFDEKEKEDILKLLNQIVDDEKGREHTNRTKLTNDLLDLLKDILDKRISNSMTSKDKLEDDETKKVSFKG